MSTVTAGRISNAPRVVECPSWCVIDHTNDPFFDTADFFHRGPEVDVPVPDGAKPICSESLAPTHLVDHCNNPEWSCISVGTVDDGFDMETVEQVDAYLAYLKTYVAAVEEMRDRFAAIKEQQSSTA